MTDINVLNIAQGVEKRSWLLSQHGTDEGTMLGCTLDTSKFTANTHYPKGSILSGLVLAKITATGLYAPYTSGATDGTQNPVGILFSSLRVIRPDGSLTPTVAGALMVHGFVNTAKLPISPDSTTKTALPLIVWAGGE
ncbi:head decoration protein (plasmid) [Nocardia sp. CA-151230]|uniref:head decoration protein n=1 Tax=Nocardia sp. CA-151230 TaxID=3239982 RepID=UPI003D8BC84D